MSGLCSGLQLWVHAAAGLGLSAALVYGMGSAQAVKAPEGDACARPGEEQPLVAFSSGRVTVRVRGCTLSWVLGELSRAARINIVVAESAGDGQAWADLSSVPLDEALRRILKGLDAFYLYGASEDSDASLRAVWVYPKTQARGLQPGFPEGCATPDQLESRLADPDPLVRSRAYQALLERNVDARTTDRILSRLARDERDDGVRLQAVAAALNTGRQLSSDLLFSLAFLDPSEGVRMLALGSTIGSPEARAVAARALTDQSQEIRDWAREILDQLNASSAQLAAPQQGQAAGQAP